MEKNYVSHSAIKEKGAIGYDSHYLLPADLFISTIPHKVITVLGSCVSVALWDSSLKIGGINHYMLPRCLHAELQSTKFGDYAIHTLIRRIQRLGSMKHNLKAFVLGGSEQIKSSGIYKIGQRNIELAFEILEQEKIPVHSSNIGGEFGRKIIFFTDSGELYIKNFNNEAMNTCINVIIVDDNYAVRKGIALHLKQFSNVNIIAEAENGQQFLDLLPNVKVDIVFMDIEMPVMNGFETLKKFSASSYYGNTKILALSTRNDVNTLYCMIELGINGFLVKDTFKDEVAMAIPSVMNGNYFFSKSLKIFSNETQK